MWERALDEAGLTEVAVTVDSDTRAFTYPHRYHSFSVHHKAEPSLPRSTVAPFLIDDQLQI